MSRGRNHLEICVDFDGTPVTHEYPKVGRDVGAVPVLKRLVDAGHKLILFTMRSGKELKDAENWFKEKGIPLYGVNVNPTQKSWTSSPKAYGQLYIDDAALGIPLIINGVDRPYVDWPKVEIMLEELGVLPKMVYPITPSEFSSVFKECTEDIMNGEEAINVVIKSDNSGIKITFDLDCEDAGVHMGSYVTINDDKYKIRLPEIIEFCGIEEMLENKLKEIIK